MSLYALIINNAVDTYPYSKTDLRLSRPDVSWPTDLSDEEAAAFGCILVAPVAPPTYDSLTQKLVEATPVAVNGGWQQVWTVVALTQQEIDQRTSDQADAVRADRNQRLADCDWTQVLDAPVDQAAWAAYRQQLRDVPQQAGFPWEVTWPVPPS